MSTLSLQRGVFSNSGFSLSSDFGEAPTVC